MCEHCVNVCKQCVNKYEHFANGCEQCNNVCKQFVNKCEHLKLMADITVTPNRCISGPTIFFKMNMKILIFLSFPVIN